MGNDIGNIEIKSEKFKLFAREIGIDDLLGWLRAIYEVSGEDDLDTALDLCYTYKLPIEQQTAVILITELIHQEASGKIVPPINLTQTYRDIAHGTLLDSNPLSGLPCNYIIRIEFEKKLSFKETFHVCCLSLSESFTAHPEPPSGPKVEAAVKFAASVLAKHCAGNFIGHLANDDFMFFLPILGAQGVLESIVGNFDAGVGSLQGEVCVGEQARGESGRLSSRV